MDTDITIIIMKKMEKRKKEAKNKSLRKWCYHHFKKQKIRVKYELQ